MCVQLQQSFKETQAALSTALSIAKQDALLRGVSPQLVNELLTAASSSTADSRLRTATSNSCSAGGASDTSSWQSKVSSSLPHGSNMGTSVNLSIHTVPMNPAWKPTDGDWIVSQANTTVACRSSSHSSSTAEARIAAAVHAPDSSTRLQAAVKAGEHRGAHQAHGALHVLGRYFTFCAGSGASDVDRPCAESEAGPRAQESSVPSCKAQGCGSPVELSDSSQAQVRWPMAPTCTPNRPLTYIDHTVCAFPHCTLQQPAWHKATITLQHSTSCIDMALNGSTLTAALTM